VLAGCTVAAYENTMSAVRKHLNMLPDVTFDNLMVALGSSTMKVPVDELWKDFQHFYLEQFKGVQQKNIMRVEINRTPCWKGATVYCCAQALKHNLNKTKLKELCACSMTELNKSIKEIQTKSKKKLEELKERMTRDSSSNKRKRGIKRTFEDKDSGDSSEEEDDMADQSKTRNTKKRQKLDPNTAVTGNGTPKKKLKTISGIVSMVDYTDYTTTKQFRDYQTWKTEILERLRDIVSA
ncbi:hypothetical protein BDF20DRAFT_857557, partial [Mycotypha africana]|uniref:uncharacterized protein n=1 Tax=Mycotypha africana TaxID=64632 RepID=UPI002301E48D